MKRTVLGLSASFLFVTVACSRGAAPAAPSRDGVGFPAGTVAAPALGGRAATGAAAAIPGPPTNLTASSSGNSVLLTWTAPADATGYFVEAGSAPGLANLANFSTGSTATTFSANGVGNGTYYVRVRALGGAGASAPSNEATLVVGSSVCASVPNVPGGLAATVNGNIVTLTWGAPGGACPALSYMVRAGASPGATGLANANVGAATSFVTTVADGDYYLQVRAVNAYGESAGSNEILLLVGGTPSRWLGVGGDGMIVELNPQGQCPGEYDLQLDLITRGAKLTGTATTRLRKTIGVVCGDVLGEVATWPIVNGTIGTNAVSFDFGNIGSHRFSGTYTAARMTGTFVITQTVPMATTETGRFTVNRQ